jgi:hypothetical protein
VRRSVTSILVASLLMSAVAFPASADGGVESSLSPPPGQTAVKITDELTIQGVVASGASVTATLQAVNAAGTVLGSYNVSSRVAVTGTAATGTVTVTCFNIPGCFEGDASLRAQTAGFRVLLQTADGSDTSERVDLDEQDPFLLSYGLIDTTHIVVSFNEDVADPEGDKPSDWTVNGQRSVVDVAGIGDERILTLLFAVGSDTTPEVQYLPTLSPSSQLPNVPYLDGAGNDLLATARFAKAANRIAPPTPTIAAVDGDSPSYESDDKAVPILGSDSSPIVAVDGAPDGAIVQLFLDDGDGRFEAAEDTVLEEAQSNGGTVFLMPPSPLPDGIHRFYARSFTDAECDPNDASSGTCQNYSGRSLEAVYDLSTVAPVLVGPATATRSRVVVSLSDEVIGSSSAADWQVTGGVTPQVATAVEIDGTLVILGFATDIVDEDQLVYEPADPQSLRDEYGNVVPSAIVALAVGVLPILTGSPVDLIEGNGPDAGDLTYTEENASFGLELTDPSVGESWVDYELRGVTATAGDDFTATSGRITFADGETVGSVTVASIGDRLDEADEEGFELVLSNPNGLRLPGDAASFALVGTLLDDDLLPGLSVDDVAFSEGETDAFVVTLDAASGRSVTVDWRLAGGSARLGYDIAAGAGTLSLDAGETVGSIPVEALLDGIDEDRESFTLELSEAVNATLEEATGNGSVIDIDAMPEVLIRDASGVEGQPVRVVLGVRGASERTIEIEVGTADGTAAAGSDYESLTRTVTLEPGQRQSFVELQLLSDQLAEGSEEFYLQPGRVTNASVSDESTGAVTVTDPAATDPSSTDPGSTGPGSTGPGSTDPVAGSTGDGVVSDGNNDGAPDSMNGADSVAGAVVAKGDDTSGAPNLPATGGGAAVLAAAFLGLGSLIHRRRD